MYRRTPVEREACKSERVPSVRKRAVVSHAPESRLSRGIAVAIWTMALQPLISSASRPAVSGDKRSPSTASTPASSSDRTFSGVRASARTIYPFCSKKGSKVRPRTPVAPTMKIRITSVFLIVLNVIYRGVFILCPHQSYHRCLRGCQHSLRCSSWMIALFATLGQRYPCKQHIYGFSPRSFLKGGDV